MDDADCFAEMNDLVLIVKAEVFLRSACDPIKKNTPRPSTRLALRERRLGYFSMSLCRLSEHQVKSPATVEAPDLFPKNL
jgi:hypothetical protein